jgi:hypothetical protein
MRTDNDMTRNEPTGLKPSNPQPSDEAHEPPATPPPASEPPLTIISHAEMNAAMDQGLATPLGRSIGFAVHFQGTWWIHYEGGWIRTDQELADRLDEEAVRITEQDAIAARNAAIRDSETRTRRDGS